MKLRDAIAFPTCTRAGEDHPYKLFHPIGELVDGTLVSFVRRWVIKIPREYTTIAPPRAKTAVRASVENWAVEKWGTVTET